MEQITSTKNEYIKLLRSLKQKKGREETGLFLAEGDKCAAEALGNAKVQALLTTQEQHPLAIQAEQKGVRAVLVSQAVMEAVSDVKTPQSAIAVVQKQQGKLPEQGLFVALEDVADPQNVGTILRTADAVGAAGVLLSGKCADYTSPKAVRAAMGSVFHLPVEVAQDFQGRLSAMKKAGVCLLGGHLQGVQRGQGHESGRRAALRLSGENSHLWKGRKSERGRGRRNFALSVQRGEIAGEIRKTPCRNKFHVLE